MVTLPCDSDTRTAGRQAEDAACRHLSERGLKLLERNFRHRRGEIDLIMQDNSCVVFVEVRYRRNPYFGGALESVDRKKQEKLVITARHYLQIHEHAAKRPARFDVIAISPGAQGLQIEWIKDAFQT